MKLFNQIKKMPTSPGIYLFLDKKNKVLYVGRAIFLKKRVLSYFQKNQSPRFQQMIDLAKKIKYYKTRSLLEAVILEASLIKKHWPPYNVREKDNRSFIYLIISKTDYPKPIIVRGKELEKFPLKSHEIFGPYQSFSIVRNALRIIRRIFPYSTCQPFSGKACFDYQIKLCPGLCLGIISKAEYQKNIKNLILFLSGQKKKLLKKLTKENPEKIRELKHLEDVSLFTKEKTFFVKLNKIEGYDISHLTGKETYGALVVFINGQADKTQYRLFKIKIAPAYDDLRALEEVIIRRFRHQEWSFPDLILIDGGRPQINYLFKVLKKEKISIPLVGISKLGGDKLVFPPKTKKSLKELICQTKEILIKIREEAHRFALKASRGKRKFGRR